MFHKVDVFIFENMLFCKKKEKKPLNVYAIKLKYWISVQLKNSEMSDALLKIWRQNLICIHFELSIQV